MAKKWETKLLITFHEVTCFATAKYVSLQHQYQTHTTMKLIHAFMGGFCSLFNIVGSYDVKLPKTNEEAFKQDYEAVMGDFRHAFFDFEKEHGNA